MTASKFLTEDELEFVGEVASRLEAQYIREQIVNQSTRIAGRGLKEVRPISIELGLLPRTHGSAMFTRGETRALVVATLGTGDDEQRIDSLEGEYFKRFMLHYNFPSYSTGEVKRMGSPGRREIGHGALAERSIARMLPTHEKFPYTIRIVSDILESNGSSSMASVCGASLALMDAGVPIKAAVAGIAMGLVQENGKNFILTDILGDEDHVGDMDFKVAGTRNGITGLQMDIKISGVNRAILTQALDQAREARLHILEKMGVTLDQPRSEMSPHAPRIEMLQINPEKIKDVIGPGGKMIRSIIADTGVKIDVDDTGKVLVASANREAMDKAVQMIKNICAEPEIGKIYKGRVRRIVDFGAFIEVLPGTDGLLHISQIDNKRVENVHDYMKEGDEFEVKIIDIDSDRKIRLSRKAVLYGDDASESSDDNQDRSRDRGSRPSQGSRRR
jgi:polyribonucleotide nucleotidyltransferase